MHVRSFHVDGFGILQHQGVEDLPRGLVLVVGANESGKSTLCAFLTAMLCGVPNGEPGYEPHRGLAYGGRLELVDGRESRGEARSIERDFRSRGSSGGPSAAVTEPADDGFQPGIYDRVFALGLEEMQGLDVLDGAGVRGRLLAAGAGLEVDPSTLIEGLRREAAQWLRPRSLRGAVNTLLARRREVREQLREAGRAEGEARHEFAQADRLEREDNARHDELAAIDEALAQARVGAESLRWLPSVEEASGGDQDKDQNKDKPDKDKPVAVSTPRLLAVVALAPWLAALLSAPLWLPSLVAAETRGTVVIVAWFLVGVALALLLAASRSLSARRRQWAAGPVAPSAEPADGKASDPLIPDLADPTSGDPVSGKLSSTLDAQRQRWQQLALEVPALDVRRSELVAEVREIRDELAALRWRLDERAAADQVGVLSQQLEGLNEQIDAGLRRWAAAVVAGRLVVAARERLQGQRLPRALERASSCLGILTDGRYRLVYGAADPLPHIVVEDDAGRRRGPAQWSRGLGDQVYLALRLGLALESDRGGESLPLLLDDVLVRFDGRRRRRAAGLFLALARRRQIFYFASHDDAQEIFRCATAVPEEEGSTASVSAVPAAVPVPGAVGGAVPEPGTQGAAAGSDRGTAVCEVRLRAGRVVAVEHWSHGVGVSGTGASDVR